MVRGDVLVGERKPIRECLGVTRPIEAHFTCKRYLVKKVSVEDRPARTGQGGVGGLGFRVEVHQGREKEKKIGLRRCGGIST